MGQGGRGGPQASPHRPSPGLQSGPGQQGRRGVDGVCPAAEGTGCGVRGSLTNPPPGGPQGEDHRGACVTLLTPPHPQGGRDFQGCWAGPGSPHLCRRGRVRRGAGAAGDASPGGGNGGPRARRRLWGPPHGQPRRLSLSLGWTLEGKERTPSSPRRLGGWPVLTQPRGHPRTLPGVDRLGGAPTTPTPTPAPGPLAVPGPSANKRWVSGYEMEKRTGGRARRCRGLHPERASPGGWACLAGQAPDQSGCRRTQDNSLSLGAPPDPRVLALGRSPPQGPTRCLPAKQCGPQCRRPWPAVRSPQQRAHRPLQLWTLLASLSVRS